MFKLYAVLIIAIFVFVKKKKKKKVDHNKKSSTFCAEPCV